MKKKAPKKAAKKAAKKATGTKEKAGAQASSEAKRLVIARKYSNVILRSRALAAFDRENK